MSADLYQDFLRRATRNLMLGTALSIVPAGAFYFFTFDYQPWQLAVLCVLGLLDLALFLPLDLLILRWSLRPVQSALAPGASTETARAGMARLLNSPWLVLVRVYGTHAPLASAGITLLVMAANRLIGLGIPSSTFPLYWVLNLSVIPIAHVVYEFAGMERATQPVADVLVRRVRVQDSGARPFTLHTRMKVFFPLLALAPMVIMGFSVFQHARETAHDAAQTTQSTGISEESEHLIRDLLVIGGGSAALFLYLMYTLGGQVREQTTELIRVLDRLGAGTLDARTRLYTTSELGQIAAHINDMAAGLGERERLRELFGAYMTPEVAHDLLAQGENAGRTEKRFVALLFLDVRGFTAFSREHPPEQVVGVLNRLFDAAVQAVAASGGTVNKYLGDGLLAVFGAPVGLENPCAAAIAAGVEIVRRVGTVNAVLAGEGVAALKVGIGIHAGEVVVGTIGSPAYKLEYTVIGDAVNVASRIEQLTKKLATEILVSKEALDAAGSEWQRRAGPAASEEVKGVERPVVVYAIAVSPGPDDAEKDRR